MATLSQTYRELLADTEHRYQDYLAVHGSQAAFGYGLTSTRLSKNAKVVLGLNWGTGKNADINCWRHNTPPHDVPEKSWKDLTPDDLGSLVRIRSKLIQHCPDSEVIFGNVCLFRTPKASDVSNADLSLSFPVIWRLLTCIEPSLIVFLTTRVFNISEWCQKVAGKEEFELPFMRGAQKVEFKAIRATIQLPGREVPACYLPHPNQPLPRAVRDEAWAKIFR